MESEKIKLIINKIKRAKPEKKTEVWHSFDLLRDESEEVVREMVLSLPPGYYRLHGRETGTNLVDKVYEIYGLMPSIYVNESMMLGLQALYPDRVYASFTHGLDALEIKKQPRISHSGVRLSRGSGRITQPMPRLR